MQTLQIFCIEEEQGNEKTFLLECYFDEEKAYEEAQKLQDDYPQHEYYIVATDLVDN